MEVWELRLTWLGAGLLLAAWVLYLVSLRRAGTAKGGEETVASSGHRLGELATRLTLAAFAALAAVLVIRGLRAGHWPMATAYEFTVCFATAVTLAWLGLQVWAGEGEGGAFTVPIALGLLLYGLSMPPPARQVRLMVPALNSIWFQVHVTILALAYGAFAVAAGGGVMYLLRSQVPEESPAVEREPPVAGEPSGELWHPKPSNPGPHTHRGRRAELLMWRGVAVGFPLMTAGMLTGAIWAQLAWGRYWGWDLKEIWALLIWLVYLVFLHARAVRGWHGRPLALLTLLGFAVVLFTFLGTGWLARKVGLESLHAF